MENVAPRRTGVAGAALLWLVLAAAPAFCQYFGQNKVQYETFRFFVLKTDHFQIYHYPEGAPAVLDASGMLTEWYTRHEDSLGFGIRGLQKVVLYDSPVNFLQTNAVPGAISQAEGGVTESLGNRVVVPLTGVPADNFHVLGHELVHAFQYGKLASPLAGGYQGGAQLPLWFMEGMAEYLSKGGAGGLTDMWMRDAVIEHDVPSIQAMAVDPDRYFPYRFGDALWDYVARAGGAGAVREFFDQAIDGGIEAGIRTLFGLSVDAFSRQWREDLQRRYEPQLEGRTAPAEVGRAVPGASGGLNLSPAVSPDGRYIAVFDDRNVISMDLDLVDAATGRLIRRLARSDTDAHFDALRFIDSAGAWSADSRSFAFVVYREGDDAIAIVDAATGSLSRVIPFESIDDISGLSWSPDGRKIVMSATSKAIRDLYVVDLGTGALEQLTDSWNAEIEPVWSPDGASIAYATDVGRLTDREGMRYGSMNLAVMDVSTRQARIISMRDGARHINPQYSPDGGSLYFVADVDGYSDVYRYAFDDKRFYRLTRAATGVSGPTLLSPCLSVARAAGDLVLTLFTKHDYQLRRIAAGDATGEPAEASEALLEVPLAELEVPPAPIPGPAAPAAPPAISPYRPSFQLVSISQASIGLALSPYGAAFGAAVETLFEDVLGNNTFDVAAEVNGGIDTLGGQIVYTNDAHRLDWGVGIAHVPQQYLFLLPSTLIANPQADTAIASQMIFTDQADLLLQYPFSSIRRVESDLGYELIWGESTASVDYYQAGLFIGQASISVGAPTPLSLFHGSLAFVGDNSIFGFTDPLRGYRYRLEAEQTFGSLLYLTGLADARGYLFLRPFTFAVRGLQAGRYLTDAENPALAPFFLGYADLVRGYEPYTYSAAEGPLLARLSGSRIGVFNVELRVPLLGTEQLGLIRFPELPTELALFYDAGIAWSDSQPPTLDLAVGAASGPVMSAGVALRFNLLGVLVLQVFYAWPFQRPAGSGYVGFLIEEGW